MLERRGNLWTFPPLDAFRVIPMGGTTFQQACQHYPDFPLLMAKKMKHAGEDKVYQYQSLRPFFRLITVPIPRVHGMGEPSIVRLERVFEDLATFLDPHELYIMPRLGCGAGGYDWVTQVRPLLLPFPDNVFVVTR
jgi:hypothetical protein